VRIGITTGEALVELERAAAYIADGRRTALHYGDEYHAGWFKVESALLAFVGGDWSGALDGVSSFLTGLGERKHYMIGPAQMVLGRILAERGDVAEGIASSETSLEFARSVKEQQQLLPALASHACVLLRAGRSSEAASLVDEYLDAYSEQSYSVADLTLALNLLGRDADFAKLRLNDPSPWAEAATEFAGRDFAAAAERYAGFGARLYEAESRLRLAKELSGSGRDAEAERQAAAAARFFERAGAPGRAGGLGEALREPA
jgi:hypothetical protein